MKSFEGQFSSDPGVPLFYRYYQEPAASKTLVILHGHGEHSGRYEKFSRFLQGQSVSIATYDARGYGRSGGKEVYVDSFEDFLTDLTAFIGFLEKTFEVKGKVHLLGHSLGGLMACHWALRYPEKISALFLSSPCLGLRLPQPIVGFNALLNKFLPGLIFCNPVYPPYLTHSAEELAAYKADPLIRRKISVRLLNEMLLYMTKLEAVQRVTFPFPVYGMAAGLEKVVSLDRTSSFFNRLEAPYKELRIFENFYHEIFNEQDQERVFDFLKACLQDARKKGFV